MKNFLFQLLNLSVVDKEKKKKKKKKRSRSNDCRSDEYSYSILYSDPRISEYSDTRSSPIAQGETCGDGRRGVVFSNSLLLDWMLEV